MTFAFIKNNICTNTAEFESLQSAEKFKNSINNVDAIVLCESGYSLGDSYVDGVWTKIPQPEPTSYVPSVEERLTIAEDIINFLLGL